MGMNDMLDIYNEMSLVRSILNMPEVRAVANEDVYRMVDRRCVQLAGEITAYEDMVDELAMKYEGDIANVKG
jgi:hypothetical protein